MFYQNLGGIGKSPETGGTGGTSISGNVTIGAIDIFNIQALSYWSETDFLPSGNEPPTTGAHAFDFFRVEQVGANKEGNMSYAWAVRDGDVSIPIPEPTTLALFGIGLVGLAGMRRRLKAA